MELHEGKRNGVYVWKAFSFVEIRTGGKSLNDAKHLVGNKVLTIYTVKAVSLKIMSDFLSIV